MNDEAAAFAEAVGVAADRTLAEPEAWRPGAAQDDRCPALSDALAGIGWLDVGRDPALLALAGPAALELGRRLAPLSELDALLGGSPLAGDLVRHGATRAVDRRGARASPSTARSPWPTATRSASTASSHVMRSDAPATPPWRPGRPQRPATWPG
jgi:hypothetical protein